MKREVIETVLKKMGSREFKYSGDWVMTNCPLAPWTHDKGTDSHPSFGVLVKKGISPANCFACGFSGGMLSLIREYGQKAIKDGLVAEEDVMELTDYVLLAEEDTDIEDRIVFEDIPTPPQDLIEGIGIWNEYFEGRGITKKAFEEWQLGYSKKERRALFPVYDQKGIAPVGIVGRAVEGQEPKYKNYPPRFKKSKYLYGEHLLSSEGIEKLIVVEGPIDAISIWQKIGNEGLDGVGVVSLLGAKPSDDQIDKIIALAQKEIVLMLDNDSTGIRGAQMVHDKIKNRKPLFVVDYPEGIDEAEQVESVKELLDSKVSYFWKSVERILNRDL